MKLFDNISHKTAEILSGCGAKKKLNEKSLLKLVQIVEKTLLKTSKELQVDLEEPGVVVSAHIIHYT